MSARVKRTSAFQSTESARFRVERTVVNFGRVANPAVGEFLPGVIHEIGRAQRGGGFGGLAHEVGAFDPEFAQAVGEAAGDLEGNSPSMTGAASPIWNQRALQFRPASAQVAGVEGRCERRRAVCRPGGGAGGSASRGRQNAAGRGFRPASSAAKRRV